MTPKGTPETLKGSQGEVLGSLMHRKLLQRREMRHFRSFISMLRVTQPRESEKRPMTLLTGEFGRDRIPLLLKGSK